MAVAAMLYLLVGVGFLIWFLTDIYRAKVRIDNGDGTTSDRRVVAMLKKPILIAYVLGLLFLWPIALLVFLLAGPDSEDNEPQDRVPPEYR